MQEASVVHLLQPLEQWPQDAVDFSRSQLAEALQAAFERLARGQLHDDVGRAVGFQEIKHPHDRRDALQGSKRAPLLDEALAAPGEIVGELGGARQHRDAVEAHRQGRRQVLLDRDLAVELRVAGPVSDAEPALAENGHDLIAADRLPRLERDEIDIRDLALAGDVGRHAGR